jgi:hypothetical protein
MNARDAWLFAEALSKTPLLPDSYRNQPASVLWALEYGRALGLDVVTTITTIHVIKGKPTQSADLMLSRARAAGHRVRIQSDRTRCVVRIVRADDPESETAIEWTLEDAVTAGLCEIRNGRPWSRSSKGEPQAWEKYPRAMLRARAVSEAVREACPEVLHGAIYTPEELGAYVDQDGNPVDAPVQQLRVVQAEQASPQRDFLSEAKQATGAERVRQLWSEAKAAGAPEDCLAQIAEVGRQKAAQTQAEAESIPDAELVEEPGAEHAAAVAELRAVANQAGMSGELDEEFYSSYGLPIAEAHIDNIRQMTGLLRGAA